MNEQIYAEMREFHDNAVAAMEALQWWLRAHWTAVNSGEPADTADEFRETFIREAEAFRAASFPGAFETFAVTYEQLAREQFLPLQPSGCESYHRLAQMTVDVYYCAASGIGMLTRAAHETNDSHETIGWLRREWAALRQRLLAASTDQHDAKAREKTAEQQAAEAKLERGRQLRNEKKTWSTIAEELEGDRTQYGNVAKAVTRYADENNLSIWKDQSKKKKKS